MRQNSIFVFGEKIDVLEKFKPSEVQEAPDDGLESDWAILNKKTKIIIFSKSTFE